MLVDTGSELSWIRQGRLAGIGIEREKNLRFMMANGTNIARSVGFAVIRVGKAFTVDEVVFAEQSDLELLGARTLEGLNLKVDARNKELVAAGPLVAAGNVRASIAMDQQLPSSDPRRRALGDQHLRWR